jgi:hypothetical protein
MFVGLRARWIWGVLGGLLLFSSPAIATHEADHRFTVYGTVHDEGGKPVKDAKVIVVDPRLDEGMTAFTDRNGDYEALLHLHNTDLGDEIIVTVLDQRKSVRAEFDPGDKVTVRKARVDFGAPGSDRPGSGWSGSPALLGSVLLAMAVTVYIYFRRSRRRKHRASKKARKKGR